MIRSRSSPTPRKELKAREEQLEQRRELRSQLSAVRRTEVPAAESEHGADALDQFNDALEQPLPAEPPASGEAQCVYGEERQKRGSASMLCTVTVWVCGEPDCMRVLSQGPHGGGAVRCYTGNGRRLPLARPQAR